MEDMGNPSHEPCELIPPSYQPLVPHAPPIEKINPLSVGLVSDGKIERGVTIPIECNYV
jgi:hypothetical protein